MVQDAVTWAFAEVTLALVLAKEHQGDLGLTPEKKV
jgi:hypothetical protein